MDREAFIERQVAFQLGTWQPEPGLNLADWVRAAARGRMDLIYHDPSDRSFVPADRGKELVQTGPNEWKEVLSEKHKGKPALTARALRNASFLKDMYSRSLDAPVVVDMQDAVRQPNAFPVFQYNRQAGAPNAILWPHRRVHTIGAAEFCRLPDDAEPELDQKQPTVFWRGALRGFSTFGGTHSNVKTVIKWFFEGKIDKELLLAHLRTVPRYAFVSRYCGMDGFDVGFKQPPEFAHYLEIPEIGQYETSFAGPAQQRLAKYLVSVQGTDVGSSFGWQVGTRSVLLKEAYGWEVFFDCHFRPWEHFVPVASDFSDVAEKVSWCEENPDACRQMTENRHVAVRLLLDNETRQKALRRVVRKYNELYARWSAVQRHET